MIQLLVFFSKFEFFEFFNVFDWHTVEIFDDREEILEIFDFLKKESKRVIMIKYIFLTILASVVSSLVSEALSYWMLYRKEDYQYLKDRGVYGEGGQKASTSAVGKKGEKKPPCSNDSSVLVSKSCRN